MVRSDAPINPAVYDRIGRIYAETAEYEPWLGGEPVEDIAIYFSGDSKMDFAENGSDVSACGFSRTFPHYEAVVGTIRILQEAHLPYGVITRKQLGRLDRYKVVVLPNVLRMAAEETAAFRAYVERGGRLYAKGDGTMRLRIAAAQIAVVLPSPSSHKDPPTCSGADDQDT